jgi:hypothetical protein
MLGRREFLRRTLAGAGVVLASKIWSPFSGAESSGAESRIEVLINEPLGTISPNIYGHFAENLSGVIYDGIWVGTNSKVPNIDGIRKDLIDAMRKIKAPVVRFPGGVLRGQLRLARRRWSEREAPATHQLLGWDRERFGAGESSLRSQRIRHQ